MTCHLLNTLKSLITRCFTGLYKDGENTLNYTASRSSCLCLVQYTLYQSLKWLHRQPSHPRRWVSLHYIVTGYSRRRIVEYMDNRNCMRAWSRREMSDEDIEWSTWTSTNQIANRRPRDSPQEAKDHRSFPRGQAPGCFRGPSSELQNLHLPTTPTIPPHSDAKHNHQFQASCDYAAELTIFRVWHQSLSTLYQHVMKECS